MIAHTAEPRHKIAYIDYLLPEIIYAGCMFKMRLNIFNASDLVLASKDDVYLSYRWTGPDCEDSVAWGEGLWTVLAAPIPIDSQSLLYPLVKAPKMAGEYLLEFDFVKAGLFWFHMKGSDTLKLTITVASFAGPSSGCFVPRHSDMSFFLILGIQRSGTSVIHANLGSHPHIKCLSSELKIEPLMAHGADLFTNTPCDMPAEMEIGWRELFKALTSLNADQSTRLCGAKVAVPDAFAALRLTTAIGSHFKDLKIILIERKDKVAQFGSWQKARETQVYCSHSRHQNVISIKVDKDIFKHYVEDACKTNKTLMRLSETNPFFHCSYEEIAEDPDKFIEGIYRFLGVQPIKFISKIQKLLPDPKEYISNYDEMTVFLRSIDDLQ